MNSSGLWLRSWKLKWSKSFNRWNISESRNLWAATPATAKAFSSNRKLLRRREKYLRWTGNLDLGKTRFASWKQRGTALWRSAMSWGPNWTRLRGQFLNTKALYRSSKIWCTIMEFAKVNYRDLILCKIPTLIVACSPSTTMNQINTVLFVRTHRKISNHPGKTWVKSKRSNWPTRSICSTWAQSSLILPAKCKTGFWNNKLAGNLIKRKK